MYVYRDHFPYLSIYNLLQSDFFEQITSELFVMAGCGRRYDLFV